jgi:2,3-bisphosphoglycerate-dependent phosphoglycerate mutase
MRIFLVRHGQSRANLDWEENRRVADHAIELSEEGKEQARAAGDFLARYFFERLSIGEPWKTRPIRLWYSPYLRCRQTAAEIEAVCRLPRVAPDFDRTTWKIGALYGEKETCFHPARRDGDSWFLDAREHLLLVEQQFGIFDGLSDDERRKKYPDEQAYYEKCKRFEGKLWPKMPLGESRFEVCQRVHQAFGTFHRDARKHGIDDIVVVGHGTTNRAFVMMWLHLPYEWMHEESNPRNCSVRLLEDGNDRGYIFEGFDHPETYKHKVNRETEE